MVIATLVSGLQFLITSNSGLQKQNLICVTCHVSVCVQYMNQPMILVCSYYSVPMSLFLNVVYCYYCIMLSVRSEFY